MSADNHRTASDGSGSPGPPSASSSTAEDARGWLDAKVTMESWATRMIQQNQELREANDALRKEMQDLQRKLDEERREHESDRQNWQAFKKWWSSSLVSQAKVKSESDTSSSPIPSAAAQPHRSKIEPHTPAASCSTNLLRSSGKLRLTSAERAMFERAGMPTTLTKTSNGLHERKMGYLPSPVTPCVQVHRSSRPAKEASTTTRSNPTHPLQDTTLSKENSQDKDATAIKEIDVREERKKNSPDTDNRADRSINAEFEIDPSKNDGKSFLHKTVVRNKTERKHMHAYDCECCRDYYNRIGPIAKRPFEDALGSSDDETDDEGHRNTSADNQTSNGKHKSSISKEERSVQRHKQIASRHRDYGPPPAATPPGYWDIKFPTTQQIEKINEQAKEAHEQQRRRIENDPRFRRRKTTTT